MSKKMLSVYIIETLKRYSDQEHQLLQSDIIQYIQNNYNESFERKAVGRCIHELIDLDYDIVKDKGFYLNERTFDKSEIQFLIDSLLSYKTLTRTQIKGILEKIINDESYYTKRATHKIYDISTVELSENQECLLNVEIINEAIDSNKKIAFDYYEYGLDKKLHKKREKEYIVNPYKLIISMNKYYLIGNYDKYDNLSNYRIDKIRNVKIIDEKRKILNEQINLPKYRLEHIYMFSGPSVDAKIKFENRIIDQIIDWFSVECTIVPCDDEYSYLYVRVNKNALYYWLKQYNDHVILIEQNLI
jgi:predicted DNA-binding transcriptional regulator YafY